MSGYRLKTIAMVTMLIDHITAVLVPSSSTLYLIGRTIGRISFPIFCFLIVQGHKHTRDVRKYLLRLLMFALISEIPFDFAFYYPMSSREFLQHQNIFFTLFIGLLVIAIIDYIHKYFTEKHYQDKNASKYSIIQTLLSILVLFSGCVLASLLKTDYGAIGVLMICFFYIFEYNFTLLFISLVLLNYMSGFPQIFAMFSLLFTKQYNGQKGKQANKFLFYGFYPAHLGVLSLIKHLL